MAHPNFATRPVITVDARADALILGMVRAAVPVVEPTEADVDEALKILGQARDRVCCAYCGAASAYWEHFRPLVSGREVTGFITEIQNLVPACVACDKAKGGLHWKKWLAGDSNRARLVRQTSRYPAKLACLEKFAAWREPTQVDLAKLVGPARWAGFMAARDAMVKALAAGDFAARVIRGAVELPPRA